VNDKLFVIAIVSFIPGGIAPGALSSIGELSPSIEIFAENCIAGLLE